MYAQETVFHPPLNAIKRTEFLLLGERGGEGGGRGADSELPGITWLIILRGETGFELVLIWTLL